MGSLRTLKHAGKESNLPTINDIEARHKAEAQALLLKLCEERDTWVRNLYETIPKKNFCLLRVILATAGATLILFLGMIIDITSYEWTTPIRSFLFVIGYCYAGYSVANFIELKDDIKFYRKNIAIVEKDLDSIERDLGWDH